MRQAQVRKKHQQQTERERQPQQAAHEDLKHGENDGGLLGVGLGATGHGALRQVAGTVGIKMDQPLYRQYHQQCGRDALGLRRVECQDLCGTDAVRPARREDLGDSLRDRFQTAGGLDHNGGEEQRSYQHDGELYDIGADHAAQPTGRRVEGRDREDRYERDQVAGREHPHLG